MRGQPGAGAARTRLRAAGGVALAALLLALPISLPAAPIGSLGRPPVRAVATCTGWTSDTLPPTTIRVLRTSGPAAGSVQVVPFHDYVTVVMAAEWGPDDPSAALQAGAVAVKQYAWYHAMVWRGGTAADGSCYDVVDSSADQIYAPETETPSSSEVSAVDSTWGVSLHKSGSLFVTHYDAGSGLACGQNANGWYLYQIGAMRCAEQGMTADAILQLYYGPGVEVVGGTSATPTPTAPPSTPSAAALRFVVSPQAAAAGAPLPVQPSVAVVDSTGQPVTDGPASTSTVTLSLAANAAGATLRCPAGLSQPAVAGVATFQGCSISAAGSGFVLVATAPGLSPANSTPLTVSAAVPTLSLGAADIVITWGTTADIAATLSPPPAGANVAGRTVRIERSTDGQTWTGTAALVTDSAGTVHLSVRPAANQYYRAVFDGGPDLAPATSPVQRLLVRQLALLRPDNRGAVRSVSRGTTVEFTTVVRPARSDLPVGRVEYRAYRLVGRTWTLQRQVTVTADASGLAKLPVTFTVSGRWYVRAMAVPSSANANSVWSPVQLYLVR